MKKPSTAASQRSTFYQSGLCPSGRRPFFLGGGLFSVVQGAIDHSFHRVQLESDHSHDFITGIDGRILGSYIKTFLDE